MKQWKSHSSSELERGVIHVAVTVLFDGQSIMALNNREQSFETQAEMYTLLNFK
jgi:hypothetical protein